jgi:hypothetical protein
MRANTQKWPSGSRHADGAALGQSVAAWSLYLTWRVLVLTASRSMDRQHKDDLSAVPIEVRRAVGHALFFAAQQGEKPDDAKVLKGFNDAAALEVFARQMAIRSAPSTQSASVRWSMRCTAFRRRRSAASLRRRKSWS